ncbi:MAG: VWA domain-containing protein [Bryobacteraceae bacterium]
MKCRFLFLGAAGCALALAALLPAAVYAQEGPGTTSGESVAKPKAKAPPNGEAPPPQNETPIPSQYQKHPSQANTPTYRAQADTVTVDVAVLDNHDHFIPKLQEPYFRVLEDGVPQKIVQFSHGDAPITICLVVEFSGRFQAFWSYGWYETLQAAYGFLSTLKPDDNVAVVSYAMHTHILSDFSPDKNKAKQALSELRIPGFSEANVFDALTDIAGRMSGIQGRKAILLIASGIDTFSKITYGTARKDLQEDGVPIYTISILQVARMLAQDRGMSPIANMDFLQADNEMRTFSKETGGLSFFPRFLGEYPTIFRQIESALRNEYTLSYHPTDTAHDGKFRHIKVELVNPETDAPLRIVNQKHKAIKYRIIAKSGYKAPREVE